MAPVQKFPVCDAALEAPNTKAGPLLLVIAVFGHLMPSILVRQGDKAQALTLRLLEETEDIMEEDMHSVLQGYYHTCAHHHNVSAFARRVLNLTMFK